MPDKLVWIASAPDTSWKHNGSTLDDEVCLAIRANINDFGNIVAVRDAARVRGIDLDLEPSNHIIAAAMIRPKFCYDELQHLSEAERM